MKITIADANIFIDLIHIKLHAELFALDLEIHTTLLVFNELNDGQQRALSKFSKNSKLTIHTTEENNQLKDAILNKRLSESDKSVIHLASELDAFILTGDGLLRKISLKQKIEVHGIFWLLDKFVENKLITKKKALLQLKLLMEYNRRLPEEECARRMANWK
jgi:predicted nucleic acid-binding protein